MSAKESPLSGKAARAFLGRLARADEQPIPQRTFSRWIRNGLPHRKLGRELTFLGSELSAWFARQGRGIFQ